MKRKKFKFRPFGFWERIPEERRRRMEVVAGLIFGVFAVFTLIAIVSYLFNWKTDQSLDGYARALDPDVAVANSGGKLGYRWASLLVSRWFGLGSLALVVIFGVVSWKLFRKTSHISVLKVLLLSVTGAFLSSFALAYVSAETGLDYAFGNGLGGADGAIVNRFLQNLIGAVPTLCVLGILLVLWLIFASRKFSDKLGQTPSAPEEHNGNTFTWVETPAPSQDDVEEDYQGEEDDELSQNDIETIDVVDGPAAVPETDSEEEKDENIIVEDAAELSTDVQEELPRIDVRSELDKYEFPPLDLLKDYEGSHQTVSQEELQRNNFKIRATLKTFRIEVENVKAVVGPTVTLYKVYPAPGVKIASIKVLQDDIAMALKVTGVRVVTLEDSVGIEVANDNPSIVPLKAMLNNDAFRNTKAKLPVAIGFTVQTQSVKVFDLASAPHLLVAGATKQGKSVGLNVLITSLLYSKHPSELKFVFIDPKMVEFSAYSGLLKHYLAVLPDAASEQEERNNAIVKFPKDAERTLRSLVVEMEERYKLISAAQVNDVALYNEKYKDRKLKPTEGHKYLPYIVTVVDEYADLTMSEGSSSDAKAMSRSIATSVVRLAQKGRAAGIHIVLATQRPSVDVITGLIKANFPTRIAFRVFSNTDSRTILDTPGAEKLIGNGDMIYFSGADRERVQCAYISSGEIEAINNFISSQDRYKQCYSTPHYLPEPPSAPGEESGDGMVDMKNLDSRFEEAARLVVTSQRGSTSDLQRRLGMGFARSGKVMDQLQAAGIVGPPDGSKPRQVLVGDLAELEKIIEAYRNSQNE